MNKSKNLTNMIDEQKRELKEIDEAAMIKAGKKVMVAPTPKALQSSYPAAKWLKKKMVVTLKDDAPHQNTLDVIDVELPNGDEESIYDFNIVGKT